MTYRYQSMLINRLISSDRSPIDDRKFCDIDRLQSIAQNWHRLTLINIDLIVLFFFKSRALTPKAKWSSLFRFEQTRTNLYKRQLAVIKLLDKMLTPSD